MTMITRLECAEYLRAHDDYVILTHARPDGDTVGSASALCAALRRMGKRATLFPNPEITESFKAYAAPYIESDRPGAIYVSTDVAEEKLLPVGFSGRVSIAIDHHPKNPDFTDNGLLLDGGKASCGEIVMEVIELLCGDLSKEEADLIYVALSTDCGCFQYGNTRADTHIAAAKLMEYGADTMRLNKEFFRSFSFARLRLEGKIYETMRSTRNNELNVAVITRKMMDECGVTENDCDDLANLAGKVRGNRVAVTVREQKDGRSRASVRTDGSVDASEVCARFGGGGHKMASGCNSDMPPFEFAEAIERAVNELWPE